MSVKLKNIMRSDIPSIMVDQKYTLLQLSQKLDEVRQKRNRSGSSSQDSKKVDRKFIKKSSLVFVGSGQVNRQKIHRVNPVGGQAVRQYKNSTSMGQLHQRTQDSSFRKAQIQQSQKDEILQHRTNQLKLPTIHQKDDSQRSRFDTTYKD